MRATMIRELLDLEPLGDDRFDAPVPSYDYRPNLFSGQVAGQALRAAALTVASNRPPHSRSAATVASCSAPCTRSTVVT